MITTKPTSFLTNQGIAIGPILFIIALLAIIAAAVAASNGWIATGTSPESTRLLAETLLQQSNSLSDGVNIVRNGQGYPDTSISFVVPDGQFVDSASTDHGQDEASGFSVTACSTGNVTDPDTCRVYATGGGSMVPISWPLNAADQTLIQSYLNCPYPGSDPACRAPNTVLIQIGSNTPLLAQSYAPVTQAVCMEINNIVGVVNNDGSNNGNDAPNYTPTWGGSVSPFDGNFFNSSTFPIVFGETCDSSEINRHAGGIYAWLERQKGLYSGLRLLAKCTSCGHGGGGGGGGDCTVNTIPNFVSSTDFCYFDGYQNVYNYIHVL